MGQSLSGLEKQMKVAKFVYDFAKDGGAVGAVVVGANLIPANALVVRGMVHVDTAVLSGGSATVALGLETATDILAATAKASLTLAAKLDTVPVGTAATAVKTTAARGLTVTVGTAALTAGKITVFLEYYTL